MSTFADFWNAYPSRKGSKAKAEAEKRFKLAIKKGADPTYIISSAKKYRDESREQRNIDTPFVCLASTWLNQKRWMDYAFVPAVPVDPELAEPVDPRWTPVREKLVASLGEDVVVSWMDKLKIVSVDGAVAQLKAPSKFVKSWVESRYMDPLTAAWVSVNKETTRIDISL